MRISFLIAGIALVAGIIVSLNYFFGQEEPQVSETLEKPLVAVPEPVPKSSSETLIGATPPSPEPETPALILPTLDESDGFVRAALTDSELPPAWIGQEDLLRRLAVVVENASRGEYPRSQLGFLAPEGKFKTRDEGDALYVDPLSYQRYDRYLDILESVPTQLLAGLLSDVDPLLDEAVGELGGSAAPLPQLLKAIDQILAVPVIREDIELIQPKVLYEYADPALEGLSAVQKQALRMGPDNLTRLKSYLIDLRTRLLRR